MDRVLLLYSFKAEVELQKTSKLKKAFLIPRMKSKWDKASVLVKFYLGEIGKDVDGALDQLHVGQATVTRAQQTKQHGHSVGLDKPLTAHCRQPRTHLWVHKSNLLLPVLVSQWGY